MLDGMRLLQHRTMNIDEKIEEFKKSLNSLDDDEIVEKFILGAESLHLNARQIHFIKRKVATIYGIQDSEIEIFIVGSAKLGFSLSEKKSSGTIKPRYRKFSIDSDIDVAIISSKIFNQLWNSFSTHSYNHNYFPWDSDKLGDYLISGSFRPDKFPNIFESIRWWDCFNKLSNNNQLDRRKVSGCIYYSYDMLKKYQIRSVRDCRLSEELKK